MITNIDMITIAIMILVFSFDFILSPIFIVILYKNFVNLNYWNF